MVWVNPLKILFRHWPVKLLALLAAAVVWSRLGQAEPLAERQFIRPLQVVGVSSDRVATSLPQSVEITVRGTTRRVESLAPDAVNAYMDLSEVEPGEFRRPVEVRLPPEVELVSMVPAEVIGSLDLLGEKILPVQVWAPDGVPIYNPTQVSVAGPSRILAQAQAAAGLALEGATTIPLYAVDSEGKPLTDIKLDPDRAQIESVSPLLTEKAIAIQLEEPPSNLELVSANLPNSIRVVGPPGILDGLEEVGAQINWREGSFNTSLRLSLPQGVSVIGNPTARIVTRKIPPPEPEPEG